MKNVKKKTMLMLTAMISLCMGCAVANEAFESAKSAPKPISKISEFSGELSKTIGEMSETSRKISKETSKLAEEISKRFDEETSETDEGIAEADEEISASVDEVSEPVNEQGNAYFFGDNQTQVVCDAWINGSDGEQKAYVLNVDIKKLKKLERGTLYCMQLEQPKVEGKSDILIWGRQYLGYYYVTKDEIYQMDLDEYEETGGYTDEINERIIGELEANGEQSLEDQGFILVNCEENMDRIEDEQGWYSYVEVIGDTHIYYFYNSYTGGTRTYRKIIWQKGKGMVYYLLGAGNGLLEVELYVR